MRPRSDASHDSQPFSFIAGCVYLVSFLLLSLRVLVQAVQRTLTDGSTKVAMKRFVFGLVLALGCLISRPANAESILFTGTGAGASGVTLNASAFFDISGDQLTIRLSNLSDSSGSAHDSPTNQLTGLFFDLPDNLTLSPVSATIDAGMIRQGDKCDVTPCTSGTTNVGGEFRYSTGNYPGFADRGIASAGYIGGSPNFNGPNLVSPDAVGGPNFSIIAPITGQNAFNPNGGLSQVPLIEGSVEFAMTVSGGTLTAADLKNVSFQYGTNTSEPRLHGAGGGGGLSANGSVPEPA